MKLFGNLLVCALIISATVTCADNNQASSVEQDYKFRGQHLLASYYDCDHNALADVNTLRQVMEQAVVASGATLLKSAEYIFEPDGITAVYLLSESHASIHTYPEHNACFVDLFTCGNKCSSEKFNAVLQSYLKPQRVDKEEVIRK